jgi:hypothetical protein
MSHVFISYSTKNASYAHGLADSLVSHGFDVWIDNAQLRSGDDWWQQIVQALRACSAFAVVLTPESDQSRWVQREITLADNWNKPMLPLLLAGDINTDNFLIFVRTQYEDVRHGGMPSQTFFNRLAQHAAAHANRGEILTGQQMAIDTRDDALLQAMHNSPVQQYQFSPVGVWYTHIQQTFTGMIGSGNFTFYTNGALAAQINNPMGVFEVQGHWQIAGNQLMLQGVQYPVMMPFNRMPYMTLLVINDASPAMFRGSTSAGEVFVCQRTG